MLAPLGPLLLLDLRYPVRVLVRRRVAQLAVRRPHAPEQGPHRRADPAEAPRRPALVPVPVVVVVVRRGRRRVLLLLEQAPRLALAAAAIFRRVAVAEAVRVARRLAVAEVGTVAAPADAARHPRLLDRLADHDAVLLELLREDGVQERVAARVERQDEHGEDLGLLERDEAEAGRRGEREERDGRPAEEVGEHEQRHALGDARVVRVPRLRAADRAVHLSGARRRRRR